MIESFEYKKLYKSINKSYIFTKVSLHKSIKVIIPLLFSFKNSPVQRLPLFDRAKNFERGGDYDKTWKASEDGKVNTNGPRVIVGENAGPQGPIITR